MTSFFEWTKMRWSVFRSELVIFYHKSKPTSHDMLSRQGSNGEEWQQTARLASLDRFDPQKLGYFSDHLVDVYEEAITITRPPLQPNCRRPVSNKTGYIVCVYKVFDGDDGEKFERNWLYWTGVFSSYRFSNYETY